MFGPSGISFKDFLGVIFSILKFAFGVCVFCLISVPFSLFGFWIGLLCLLAVPFLVFGFCYLVFLLEDRAYTHGRKNGEKSSEQRTTDSE